MRPRNLPDEVIEGLDPDVIVVEGEDPADLASTDAAQLGHDRDSLPRAAFVTTGFAPGRARAARSRGELAVPKCR